jgi:hypothetical protein
MAFNEADHFRWAFGSEIGLPRFEQWLLEASSAASFLRSTARSASVVLGKRDRRRANSHLCGVNSANRQRPLHPLQFSHRLFPCSER